jgi:hypothetical protein
MPLFAPEGLNTLYRDCYSGANENTPLAWVLVYATMGLTYRMRAMSLFASPRDTPMAEWFLTKILGQLPELLLGSPSLRLVQASLGMAFLLETSGNCQRASLFASTALNMAQELGYNEITSEQIESAVQHREMAYCFWIAFILDAHFSIAGQHPGAQRLADVETPMPEHDVLDWWEPGSVTDSTNNEWNLNVFAQHTSLAVVEAEAAEELFSARSRKRLPRENAIIYERIIARLQQWREKNALSRLEARDVVTSMYRSDIVHSIILEGAYFRTLYQLHATNALVGFAAKIDAFASEALEAMMELRSTPCYDDAARFLKLAVLLPQGNTCTTW